jgi:DnaJ-class molecular chaperone
MIDKINSLREAMGLKQVCPDCNGVGEVEYDHWSPRSFQDDAGGFVSKLEVCDTCIGHGEVDVILRITKRRDKWKKIRQNERLT